MNSRNWILTALLFALAVSAAAQDQPATAPFVGAGVSVSRAQANLATGWVVAGACFSTGTCPYTDWENVQGRTATIQAGVLQRIARSGGLSLAVLGLGGLATTPAATGTDASAVFSGGFALSYTRPSWHGVSLTAGLKVIKMLSASEATLGFPFGVVKSF